MESLDGTPLARALAYAVAVLDGLPKPLPERHALDRNKMVEILEAMVPEDVERERYAAEAEEVVGYLPDLTDWRPRQ
jgi:hypothetical protein